MIGGDDTGDSLLDLDEPLGTFSGGAINHEFATTYSAHFSPKQTVDLPPEATKIERPGDAKWKALVPFSANEGYVYEDDSVQVWGTFNFTKFDGKIVLELRSKGADITDIQTSSKIPTSYNMTNSEPRYPALPTDNPKVMVRSQQREPTHESP